MYKILHFADLHLETSFAADNLSSSVGNWRRSDLRATLGRIFTLARERQVDAVTIGGDLFDQNYAAPSLVVFLKQQFTRLAPSRVFIVPGRHDPYTNSSMYALNDWPNNVTIFSQSKLTAAKIAPNIHLWGAAHPPLKEHVYLDGIKVDNQGINILLLHAADGAQNQDTFSITGPTVKSANFDFALLGSQHHGALWPDEKPYCVYPGSPEPLSIEEADSSHYVVLLTINEEGCHPELISINQWRYTNLEIDLSCCETAEEVVRRVKEPLNAGKTADERLIARVKLTGQPDLLVDVRTITEMVETKAHLQFEPQFGVKYDLAQLSQELTVRGTLVRKSLERLRLVQGDQERHTLLNSLYVALRALEGKQVPLFHEVVE